MVLSGDLLSNKGGTKMSRLMLSGFGCHTDLSFAWAVLFVICNSTLTIKSIFDYIEARTHG